MRRLLSPRWLALAGCALAALPAAAAAREPLRMNQIQVVNTHNSYKRETGPREQAVYEALIGQPNDYFDYLAYRHAPLRVQLERQSVRGVELDLYPDPSGGRYAEPLVRRKLGRGPLPDPAWRKPGTKVLHMVDADYETSCPLLTECLRELEAWSDDNPRHVPLFAMLELKQSDKRLVARGGVVAPPWDAAALARLEAEIRAVFDRRDLIVPGDVRGGRWPTLAAARGRVLLMFNNVEASASRIVFGNGGAYRGRDDPIDGFDEIQRLVRSGSLVRTRSDIPLATVRSNDTRMRDAALASGAQLISTDFPAPGMAARYGSDFAVRLPVRCNPVNAPPDCRSEALEPAKGHR